MIKIVFKAIGEKTEKWSGLLIVVENQENKGFKQLLEEFGEGNDDDVQILDYKEEEFEIGA